ncbi:MAG TPA: isoprenyl transferase [Acidobacteriota bacterium]|nr:isoprenyl transferase [Acidobacteriota bacterium]
MFEGLEGTILPGSEEETLLRRLDVSRLPRHVAVIMDGNGRWARERGLARIEGHKAGSDSVSEIVEASARLGIKVLSLFAFSKENWKRPRQEVSRLWALLRGYLKKDGRVLSENDLRLMVIGQRNGIPRAVLGELERLEAKTRDNRRMIVALALNYGGRAEILEAVKGLLREKGADPDALTEDAFARRLYTASLPDPDLLIRTSGEMRVSNFLLWQIAYAEIWITPVLWPDFRKKHLLEALCEYQTRERRFGDIRPR